MSDTAQPELLSRTSVAPIDRAPSDRLRPLRDSMRTHFVLLRFAAVSMLSAVIDNLTFYLVFHATGTIAGAQIAARTVSVLFNYRFVRRIVFSSSHGHHVLFPLYLLLVAVNASISYAGIRLLSAITPLGVMQSKILTETLLFALNFFIQRTLIFTRAA
jgi:putative flippase GtrA